ncbi:MAG: sugar transferase [Melioribacteraceae bacterium]|nr:sugar transferase [Melioribacteraceae bacterium]
MLYMTTSFFSSFLLGKFSQLKEISDFTQIFKRYFNAFILNTGILSIIFISISSFAPSRILIAGTLFLSFILELIFIYFNYTLKINREVRIKFRFSLSTFTYFLVLLLSLIFYVYYYFRPDLFAKDLLLIIILLPVWFFTSFFVHQYSPLQKVKYWDYFYSLFKSAIIFISLMAFATFMLKYDYNFSLMPFIISIVYSIGSLTLFSVLFIIQTPETTDAVKTKLLRATPEIETEVVEKIESKSEKYSIPNGNPFNPYLQEQLGSIYLRHYLPVFKFIEESIELTSFDIRRAVMIRSADTYNVEVLPNNSYEFYLNLHEINDMRRINHYLIEINKRLVNGGVFVGRIEPLNLRFRRYKNKYPYYLARFFYFFDFLWNRAFAKIPFFQKVYFAFSKGKNRAISLAECLGRLHYCGFSIINLREINNFIYFIAKKGDNPKKGESPSYGPLIKLKRTGKEGRKINVYKMRTMHPYSEYLQKFVFDLGNLKAGGKFQDDFRITGWGKVMRKLWLDEFPMFINFFKGELKLVGVRPLSDHYLSLYSQQLRERRKKFKPGLVPPFYVDLPQSLEEIMASEEKYLDSYEKNPILTDIKYFFLAANNILIKKARSG